MTEGPPPQDPTLQHPNCVYQIMRRHYARYTPEMVERVTGCPQDTVPLGSPRSLARKLRAASGPAPSAYAVGWTHHSVGVQIIRAAHRSSRGCSAISGGPAAASWRCAAMSASRAAPTSRRSTTCCRPTCRSPTSSTTTTTLERYLATETPPTGWWRNMPKYVVSLLKAWYGEAARGDNEWGYQFLPKLTGDVSQQPMTMAMVGRRGEGPVHPGPEPGRRRGQFRSGGARFRAASTGWWCAISP